MAKKILCIIIFSTIALSAFSQTNLSASLKIGDHVPDVLITNVYNYPNKRIRLSEFRNKIILLDFWSGACPSCITAFPEMEALQKRFKDDLQIVMVNFESKETVDKKFKLLSRASSIYKLPDLPLVMNDTIFNKLFAHKYIPHEVWIDKNMKVVAVTDLSQVTAANIQKLIDDNEIKLEVKKDDFTLDKEQPLFQQLFSTSNPGLLIYSAIFKSIPGYLGSVETRVIDSANRTIRITRANRDILSLIMEAVSKGQSRGGTSPFSSPTYDFGKRVSISVRDSSKYSFDGKIRSDLTWKENNLYCYEAILPLQKKDSLYDFMLADLSRYFNLEIRIEKRKLKCLALVRTSATDKIKNAGGGAIKLLGKEPDSRLDTTKVQFYASLTSWLVDRISAQYKASPYLFVDKTNYSGRIDVEFDKRAFANLEGLRQELRQKYDLDLIESDERLDVLIISERSL